MINKTKRLVKSAELGLLNDNKVNVSILTVNSWRWLSVLSGTSAVGVFLIALAYDAGRFEVQGLDALFWFGLLVLFLPIAGRLLLPGLTRWERVTLLIMLSIGFYFAKYLQYPLYFTYHDEFAHLRTAQDIAASGHLFNENPLIPISSYYPGLEIVTSALSSLTGFSLFGSGILVLGVIRLVLVLTLYLFYELFSNSTRIAGIATLLYMANPQFLFFDAQFSYESLALPLAIFVLFALALRCYLPDGRQRGLTVTIWLGLGAVAVIHHITSYALVAFLLLWSAISFLQNRSWKELIHPGPARAALLGLVFCGIWLIYTGDIVVGYLSPHLIGAAVQVKQIVASETAPRQLFQDGTGYVSPLWERIVAFASVALIMLGLPPGLILVWRHYRANAIAFAHSMFALRYPALHLRHYRANAVVLALAVVALLYPFSQALRLTPAGSETSVRATEFLFFGIAFVLAIGITKLWSSLVPNWRRPTIFMAVLAILLVGQLISSSVPDWYRLPGPYLVSADPRSIEPEGIAAAEWLGQHLAPGHIIGSDRINTLLMATYGNQLALTSLTEKSSIDKLFTSQQFGPAEEAIIHQNALQYIVVDRRLSTALPRIGFYFNSSVSGLQQYTRPIDPASLAKFDSLKNVSRIFDSGDIVIYDVEALTSG